MVCYGTIDDTYSHRVLYAELNTDMHVEVNLKGELSQKRVKASPMMRIPFNCEEDESLVVLRLLLSRRNDKRRYKRKTGRSLSSSASYSSLRLQLLLLVCLIVLNDDHFCFVSAQTTKTTKPQQRVVLPPSPPRHFQLFPSNDEYDANILDPQTVYGSPYGGFSRATTSRLASLPLKLPDDQVVLQQQQQQQQQHKNDDDDEVNDHYFYEVSDFFGRRYVCRDYDETELEFGSLKDSMFDIPTFRFRIEVGKKAGEEDDDDGSADHDNNNITDEDARLIGERVARAIGNDPTNKAAVLEEFLGITTTNTGNIPTTPLSQQTLLDDNNNKAQQEQRKTLTEEIEDEFDYFEIDRRLDALEGLCVLRRFRYWTYEWCYEGGIHRFHLKTKKGREAEGSIIQIQEVSNLGYSKSKKIEIMDPDIDDPFFDEDIEDDDENDKERKEGTGVEEELPLGIVKEKFTDGDRCNPETKKAKTTVHMKCCSALRTTNQHPKSYQLLHGVPHDIPLASINNFWEDPNKECRFHMDICTPILCSETDVYDYMERIELLGIDEEQKQTATTTTINTKHSSSGKKKKLDSSSSIMEILDETLGTGENNDNNCIHSEKDGWWTYEYCHKKYVRQFNGDNKKEYIDPNDDTQYLLGYYNSQIDNEIKPEDEWMHVINGTDIVGYGGFTKRRGGNGAYFEMEFIEGEMCLLDDDYNNNNKEEEEEEDDDGGNSFSVAIERSCSVRFSCDTEYSVRVREDSTCHYVVEVTVPTLCEHVLFKPALTKKRVVKCLQIDG